MARTIVVTGGTRGIGRAIAEEFLSRGDRVAVCYRSNEAAAASLQAAYPSVHLYALDVGNGEAVTEVFTAIARDLGPVDVLVNNAGEAWAGLLSDMTEEEWDRLYTTNVKGCFLCSRQVIPAMVRARNGCIINLSSMWGQVGASCEVAYSASKAAVIGFTKALAKELGPSGVRVNCVAPGVIETDMVSNLTEADLVALAEETPLGRLGSPADVAAAVTFLASPAASFLTGQVIAPNGGFVM